MRGIELWRNAGRSDETRHRCLNCKRPLRSHVNDSKCNFYATSLSFRGGEDKELERVGKALSLIEELTTL